MIQALSYFCFPSICFHCERPLLKNSGLCLSCFSSLSLLDQKDLPPCESEIAFQGALFPNIDPLVDLLARTLSQKHEKMIQWFSVMLVLQAGFLDLPWCDAILFVPGAAMKRGLRSLWHEHLTEFFQVPIIRLPIKAERFPENQTLYLIDWYLRPHEAYHPIIEPLTSLYPQTFVLLSIFDAKPF